MCVLQWWLLSGITLLLFENISSQTLCMWCSADACWPSFMEPALGWFWLACETGGVPSQG